MSLINDKREIYGQIAAFRASAEGFPKFDLNNSFDSIDNSTNSLDFLSDLLKATVGFDALRSIIANILTYQIGDIENSIKKALKTELKELVSCGVNPSIPDFFKHQNIIPTSTGIELDLRKVDYLGIMLIDPTSRGGLLTYEDINGGLNSVDFHTYLFETIQLDGTQTDWGSQTLGSPNDVLSIEFNSVGTTNNTLNIKASEYYSDPANNKKLTDLNNDYIDSVDLFGSANLINLLVDSLFGSVSLTVGKSPEQIKKEVEIEDIIERILNTDEDGIIDDSFFTFSNEDIRTQEEEAKNRSRGVRILSNCDNVETRVSTTTLSGITTSIQSATTVSQTADIINAGIDDIAAESANNVEDINKVTAKLEFMDGIIKKLMIKMGSIILSPKVITIFAINHHIIYGTNIENPIEWMGKNRILIKAVLDSIREKIIQILLEVVIKSIKDIIKRSAIQVATEYAKSHIAQLVSLTGIPQDVLRLIQGLG